MSVARRLLVRTIAKISWRNVPKQGTAFGTGPFALDSPVAMACFPSSGRNQPNKHQSASSRRNMPITLRPISLSCPFGAFQRANPISLEG